MITNLRQYNVTLRLGLRNRKLTFSGIWFSLLRSDCSISVWRKTFRESAVIFSPPSLLICFLVSLLSRVSGSLILQVRSLFRNEERKVTLRSWEETGDWGKYEENSEVLTIVLERESEQESRDRCRVNAVLPSSVEELSVALIISALIALLYDFEYASVRTIRKIKLKNSQSRDKSHTRYQNGHGSNS